MVIAAAAHFVPMHVRPRVPCDTFPPLVVRAAEPLISPDRLARLRDKGLPLDDMSAVVRVVITADGNAIDASILRSSDDMWLDSAAIAAALSSTYMPAETHCRTFAAPYRLVVPFAPLAPKAAATSKLANRPPPEIPPVAGWFVAALLGFGLSELTRYFRKRSVQNRQLNSN